MNKNGRDVRGAGEDSVRSGWTVASARVRQAITAMNIVLRKSTEVPETGQTIDSRAAERAL